MKVLFDQNVPRPLARFLVNHEVVRSAQLGWEELKNGDLIKAAEKQGFDLLVTADRKVTYQQNLNERSLGIVVLPSGQWPEVKPHVPLVVCTIDGLLPGSYVELPRAGRKSRPLRS